LSHTPPGCVRQRAIESFFDGIEELSTWLAGEHPILEDHR
jgi:hypothetical protein